MVHCLESQNFVFGEIYLLYSRSWRAILFRHHGRLSGEVSGWEPPAGDGGSSRRTPTRRPEGDRGGVSAGGALGHRLRAGARGRQRAPRGFHGAREHQHPLWAGRRCRKGDCGHAPVVGWGDSRARGGCRGAPCGHRAAAFPERRRCPQLRRTGGADGAPGTFVLPLRPPLQITPCCLEEAASAAPLPPS